MLPEDILKALSGLGQLVVHLQAENNAARAILEEMATTKTKKLTPAQFRAKYDRAVLEHKERMLLAVGDDNPLGASLLGADEAGRTSEQAPEDDGLGSRS
jgi:hypothetical protein